MNIVLVNLLNLKTLLPEYIKFRKLYIIAATINKQFILMNYIEIKTTWKYIFVHMDMQEHGYTKMI